MDAQAARYICLIQLIHALFRPIGVLYCTYRPRADIVMFAECADMNTSPQDRSGGLSDRPGAPTDRPSRRIDIDIDI